MALFATNRFAGDGVTTSYEFNFVGKYLARSHVKVYQEDAATLVRTPIAITDSNFLNDTTLHMLPVTPVGATLVIYRDTPKAPLVDFVNGSRFTESNLNTATRQGSFIAAEGADAVSPSGLAGVVQQVVDFSGAAGVASAQAVAARDTAVAASAAADLSASNANDSAIRAAADATLALNNKNLSDTAAYNAAISKTGADSARDAAVIAKNAAEAALDSLDDRYLGAKAVAPTTDNDGGALLAGALYWDTALPGMRSWNGSVWVTLPAATKASVGLANVDNTSDANKPVSTPQQTALNLKANNASPALTGIPTAPTAAVGVNSTQLATTAYALAAAALRYGQNNVLGTVSQAAGVPTGAIIQQGSNGNGTYIRWADGTQIATWTSPTSALPAVSDLVGSVYRSTGSDILWTFPLAFASSPCISGAVIAGINGWFGGPDSGLNNSTSCRFRLYSATPQPGGAVVQMIAIGRWF